MGADLDTLATAFYLKIDDLLKGSPQRVPWRPAVGIVPAAAAVLPAGGCGLSFSRSGG
jgi:hypothetical protein